MSFYGDIGQQTRTLRLLFEVVSFNTTTVYLAEEVIPHYHLIIPGSFFYFVLKAIRTDYDCGNIGGTSEEVIHK